LEAPPWRTTMADQGIRPWPADKVERRPLASLVPYARNARIHTPEQIRQIAASMREWGFTNPVLIDEAGQIIAGHGRVLAAQELGLTEVPVMVARGWTEAQKRAYVIADNKLALNATWDDELLAAELTDLDAMAFDTDLISFSAEELEQLNASETDPAAEWQGMPEFDQKDCATCARSRLSRLEDTVTRGFEVVAARLTGIEGRFIAIEGRLAALEAWSSDTSITPVAHGAGRIENLSTTANPATGQAHA
jgi:ParB-like nuclease domain